MKGTATVQLIKKNPLLFILHLILTLSLPVIILGVTSCIDEPSLEMASLGPENTPEEVNQAVLKILNLIEPKKLEMQEGQWVLYEINQNIEMTSTQKVADHYQEILVREETQDSVNYLVRNIDVLYGNNPSEPEVVESETQLEFDKGVELLKTLQNSLKPISELNLMKVQSQDILRTTYHSLNLGLDRQAYPPQAVQDREGCEGLKDCLMKVHELSYDQVDWYSEDKWYKTRHFYQFSTDSPYLGRIRSYCLYQQVPVGQRDYLVSQCQVLRDFHR